MVVKRVLGYLKGTINIFSKEEAIQILKDIMTRTTPTSQIEGNWFLGMF